MPTLEDSILELRRQIKLGKLQLVRWPLQKLLNRHPGHPELLSIAAYLEHRAGNTPASITILRAAIRQHPNNVQLREELGFACDETGDRISAEEQFREVIAREPHRLNATEKLSQYLMDRGLWAECEPLLQRLITLHPTRGEAWNRLGWIKISTGELAEADRMLRRAIELDADNAFAFSNRAMLASYRDDLSPIERLAIVREWADRFGKPASLPARTSRKPGRLRIGYVSPDFRAHSVATFIEPVLRNHQRTQFEVFCYSAVPVPDRITARLKSLSEHWREIAKLDDRAAAEMIRRDDIDILIDLTGHTGGNRLLLFARKPAPVQITWLGFPGTTGLSQMDYRFTDSIADPTEQSQSWHTEKLIPLPGTFFCYGGTDPTVPDVNPEIPSLTRDGQITFAVLGSAAKIRPTMIALWSQILQRVPNSRLVIKAIGVDVQSARDWIRREFDSHAIDPGRAELLGRTSTDDYFRKHGEWDVALDTFPFNGHTTTCHALWMGVPIITLAGEMHASRMGASVLHALRLDDLVATSPEQYVELAGKLAGDVARRTELRRSLRERMRASPMMNGKQFTENLESVLARLAPID